MTFSFQNKIKKFAEFYYEIQVSTKKKNTKIVLLLVIFSQGSENLFSIW